MRKEEEYIERTGAGTSCGHSLLRVVSRFSVHAALSYVFLLSRPAHKERSRISRRPHVLASNSDSALRSATVLFVLAIPLPRNKCMASYASIDLYIRGPSTWATKCPLSHRWVGASSDYSIMRICNVKLLFLCTIRQASKLSMIRCASSRYGTPGEFGFWFLVSPSGLLLGFCLSFQL